MNPISKMVLCLFFFLLSCGGGKSAGNSTQTENAIAIQIYNKDGKPAHHVKYTILPLWFVADPTTSQDSSVYVYSGESDKNGWVTIKDHPLGNFIIQFFDDSGAVIATYSLLENEPNVIETKVTLQPHGAVTGRVVLPEGVPFAWIGFYGLNRVERTDSLGHFLISNLPVGELNIVAEAPQNGGILGQTSFDVIPGDTVDIHTLSVPSPKEEVLETWRYSRSLACSSLVSDWMKPLPAQTVVTLRLDSANFDFTQAMANGGDIRIVRENNEYVPMQIAYWDTSAKRAVVKVRINATDTAQIWSLKWGNRLALSTSTNTIWDSLAHSVVLAYQSVLVADFENNSPKNALLPPIASNSWYTGLSDTATIFPYTKVDSFTNALVPADSGRTGIAAHFSYSAVYPQYALIGTRLSAGARSLAHFDSLQVWMRGNGDYTIALENLDLEKNYKAVYDGSATSHWTRLVIRPSDFLPADSVGGNYGWDPIKHQVTTFSIFAKNGTEIWLDDIRIYGINRDDLK